MLHHETPSEHHCVEVFRTQELRVCAISVRDSRAWHTRARRIGRMHVVCSEPPIRHQRGRRQHESCRAHTTGTNHHRWRNGLATSASEPRRFIEKKNVRSGTVASGHQPPKKMNYISRSKRKSCDAAPQKAKTSGRQSGYTKSCALAVAEEAAWFRAQVTPAATVSKNEDDTMAVDDQEKPREEFRVKLADTEAQITELTPLPEKDSEIMGILTKK